MTDKTVSWISVFLHSEGDPRDEPDFPKFKFWCPDRETFKAQVERVLSELSDRGDIRDWKPAGFPDPFKYNKLISTSEWLLDPLERP